MSTLRKAVQGDDTFLLSLSDGDLHNWGQIKNDYKALVTGCAAAHIQIGGKNRFSRDLESWGIPVYYVQGGDDLTHLMVKVASDKYKGYGKEARA